MFDYLLRHGVDPTILDKSGWTAKELGEELETQKQKEIKDGKKKNLKRIL